MLTIFTTTKPFIGHIKVIQTNAIKSWIKLGKEVSIILLGNEKGAKEFAQKNSLGHLPQIKTNNYQTPLVSNLFKVAQDNSNDPFLAYVNADIILFPSFLKGLEKASRRFSKFLMIGRRIDVEVKNIINFNDEQQVKNLIKTAEIKGRLHEVTGIDYFLYPRNLLGKIPDFAIGRPGWDNWLVYKAKKLGVVIDATPVIKVIHQNHDYLHLPKGKEGERHIKETATNEQLVAGHLATIDDADYVFTNIGLTKLPVYLTKLKKEIKVFKASPMKYLKVRHFI